MKKPTSLEEVISFNRAGKNETCLTYEEFLDRLFYHKVSNGEINGG